MSQIDTSFDDCSQLSLENIANDDNYNEFDDTSSRAESFPIKKLSDVFDNCAKSMSEGNMKVYLRVRPSSSKGLVAAESTISVESETSIVTNAPDSSKRAQYTKTEERHYAFTRVFGPDSQQADVFSQVAAPLLERFLQGDSCVLFAYGMTNAGKTFTIQGNAQAPGIMPHLVNAILERMADKSDWDLQTSMLEIYQEKVYDLLGKKRDKLAIRDGNGRVEVIKLSSHPIASAEEAIKLMDTASSKRSKANTFLNTGSSRSHAVYTITLNKVVGGRDMSAIFQVVDLAGAERGSRTKASVSQQKEANNINMSLMQLWRCLQAMRRKSSDGSNQSNMDIIPFRESKLTHLLMPLLGRVGLGGMAMITCVNPQGDDYDETLSILSNASLACKIKEITDLGRTTVGVVGVNNHVSHGNGHGHKYSNASSHRSSSLLNLQPKANLAGSKRNSSKCRVTSLDSADDLMAVDAEAPIVDDRLLKELQSLREEVGALKNENQSLLMANFEKETEIRTELADEMAKYSMHMLEQIQDLQEQLHAREDHYNDVTKSCKKARRKQIDVENAETVKDLKEAEEELERVKAQYEIEVAALRDEKYRLEVDLENWKEKAEVAAAKFSELEARLAMQVVQTVSVPEQVFSVFTASMPAASSVRSSRSGSMSMPPIAEDTVAVEESRKSAAAEQFKERISRDQRFKKPVERGEATGASPKPAFGSSSSSMRSPLKNINGNFPLNHDNDKKRALSPKGMRSASPVRKHQALDSKHNQPVMKSNASASVVAAGGNENQNPAGRRPLRSTMRAI